MSRKFREHDGIPFGSAYVIPYHVTIAALCRRCGHTKEMTREELDRRKLSYREFSDYEMRMVCSQCGGRGAKMTTGDFRE